MTVDSAISRLSNPVGSLPSVLAIRDLQRRLWRVLREMRVGQEELVRILQLDPLAVVRGLRAACAPIFGTSPSGWSVRRIVKTLGPALSRRLLDTPTIGVAGTTNVRRLWMHSIATAVAAQDLAAQSGLLDPEEAYMLGLLHDLPEWLVLLERENGPSANAASARRWVDHWQLPANLVTLVRTIAGRDHGSRTPPASDTATLICGAELLAELADFGHPTDEFGADAGGAVLAAAEKSDLIAAQRLRRQVEGALRTFGLDPTMPDVDMDGDPSFHLNTGKRKGSLDDVVLSVLSCTRSETYRGIVTAVTAAAVRFGAYDRAFYVKWDPSSGNLLVRSKADSSARRLAVSKLFPTTEEIVCLQAALREERPVRIDAKIGQHDGLLAALSTDELLAVPLNRGFAVPAFLLLDRSLSCLPIQNDRDTPMASTLGLTGSLLIDNLLLRRRRQRAQKFALTDSLTRLYNRRMGLVALEQEIRRAGRTDEPLTVLMCDLDHFKQLNDAHGHLQGDLALRATADVLRQTLRKSDTCCRFGGEEFLVVLPDTNPDDATVLATRLFTAVQNRGIDIQLPVTISIGLTAYRQGDTAETILQRADHALYASKDSGRNRFSVDVEQPDEVRGPA
ncbi:MAG: diguanylate cyclase [Planctomycetes bacterium]|nr:diguanylate cyclase [Planctomycetota bacterium]